MTKLVWNEVNNRDYNLGLDRGVFYPRNGSAEAWNGLVSVVEKIEVDERARYVDGVKVNRRKSTSSFSGSIEAFTYPSSFYEDILTQKRVSAFGLSYRVKTDNSYEIHIIYNISAFPSGQVYQQSETEPIIWDFTTKPEKILYAKPSSHIIVKVEIAYSWTLSALEEILYGSDSIYAHLPSPNEILNIFEENSILRVIDHGDGMFTVTGPDEAIQMLDESTFEITWPSVVILDSVSYKISSL